MRRARDHWLRHDGDFVELDPIDLNERLRQATGRELNHPYGDALVVASWLIGVSWPSKEDIDDVMASVARYLRVPWEYLEDLPLPRLYELSNACGRLLRLENGKKPSLDLRGASEDNR